MSHHIAFPSWMISRSLPLVMLVLLARAGDTADCGVVKSSSMTDQSQMEIWWSDLEKGEADACRALLAMSTQPEQAVKCLKDKLKPLKFDSVRLKLLLLRLGSSDEHVWNTAFEDLEYYDPRLAMDLEALMDRITEAPARQRLVEVLSGSTAGRLKDKTVGLRNLGKYYNFFAGRAAFGAEHNISKINISTFGGSKRKWTRAVRAIMLLGHIGTPDAVAILKEMATGHPEAQPTRIAKEVLDRLGKPYTPPSNPTLSSVGSRHL
jgi:hypothetical protein